MMFQGQGRSEAGSSVLERPSQPTFHPPRREGSVPPAQMSSRLSSPPPPSYRPPGGSGNGSFLGSSSSSSQTYPTPTVSSATSLFSSSSFEGESPGGRPSPYQSHQSHHASPYQGHSSYSPATVSAPPPSGAGTPSSSSSSSSSLPQHQQQQQHQHQYHAGSAASPPRSPGQHSSDSEQADYNREDTPFNREDTPFNREGSINPEKALKNKHVVEWLKAYIELSPDQSISRNDLYEYYRETTNIKPSVDPATFGKIVRTVFPNIATRRLGKRGFSKYHYAGIAKRPNPVPPQFDSLSDSYNDFQKARSLEPQTFLRAREGSMPPFQRASTAAPSEPPASYGSFSRSSSVTPGGPNAQQPQSQSQSQSQFQSQQAQQQAQQQAHQQAQQQQFQAQQQSLSRKRTWEEARPERFLEMYHKHMQDFTDSVVHLNFQKTEECLRFWKRLSHEELEMANQSSMSARIREVDEHAYQVILQNFIPNPLLPTPTDKIQNIRYFAKSYEYWLVVALERAPKSLAYLKLLCASTFTVDLKRRTSLNHLSKGVASLLTKPEMIYMMLDNWKRLDFESIKDQTQWSISEDSQMFDEFYSEFAHFLGANASLHEWASWFERFTFKYVDMKTENLVEFIQSAKRFLMNWTFFGSLLIRDLTLRSSNSFGAFHILKLFFDELFFYMLENRYAQFKKVCSFEKDFTFTVHPPEVRNGGTPGRIPGASNQSSSSSSSSRKEASYRDYEGHSSAPASAPAPTYPHDAEDYLGLLDQPPPHASFMPSHSWKPSSPQGNFSFPALPDYQRPSQGNGSHPHPSPSSRSQPVLPHQAHYGLDDD